MKRTTLKQLAAFCGGEYPGSHPRLTVDAVVTDSRKAVKGGAFLALKGENFDGHAFVGKALAGGAVCAVVDDADGARAGKYGDNAILVKDTLAAYADIAAGVMARDFPKTRRIAVTGSVGKTSTKELTHAVLASAFRAEKTAANHNNEVGLPQTVLALPLDTEIFVAEMGMRGFGQIQYLEHIVHPEAAIITTIGNAHLELLGSRENILKAKMEVCLGGARLPANKPFRLIVNGDCDLLKDRAKLRGIAAGYGCKNIEIITFGQDAACDYRATEVISGEHGINYLLVSREGNCHVDLPLPGEHNVYNSMAAIAAGALFGIAPEDAVVAMRAYAETNSGVNSLRQRTVKLAGGRITLMDDAYNAGPESMPASLKVMAGFTADKHIAALGDMVELGPKSPEFHLEVGRIAAGYCDRIFTVGEKAKAYVTGFDAAVKTRGKAVKCAESFDTTDDAYEAVKAYIDRELAAGHTVAILVKGSHIMHMGHISARLEEDYK